MDREGVFDKDLLVSFGQIGLSEEVANHSGMSSISLERVKNTKAEAPSRPLFSHSFFFLWRSSSDDQLATFYEQSRLR